MSSSPLGHATPAMNASDRPRGLAAIAILLACFASAGGVAWGPVSLLVAQALRPAQLAQATPLSDVEVQAVVAPARQQLMLLTLVYLIVLLLLMGAAIRLARRALRQSASKFRLAELGIWALWVLVGSVLLGIVAFFFGYPASVWLLSFALAAAIGSVMLASVALRRPAVTALSPDMGNVHRAWRIIPRVCLVVAAIISVAVYTLFALSAQFIVGFYFRFVF